MQHGDESWMRSGEFISELKGEGTWHTKQTPREVSTPAISPASPRKPAARTGERIGGASTNNDKPNATANSTPNWPAIRRPKSGGRGRSETDTKSPCGAV